MQDPAILIPNDTILEALKILIGTSLTWAIHYYFALSVSNLQSIISNIYSLGL